MFALLSMHFAERCKIRRADRSTAQAIGQQTGIPLEAFGSVGICLC